MNLDDLDRETAVEALKMRHSGTDCAPCDVGPAKDCPPDADDIGCTDCRWRYLIEEAKRRVAGRRKK